MSDLSRTVPPVSVTPLGRGTYRVESEGRARLGFAVSAGRAVWVHLDGEVYQVAADTTSRPEGASADSPSLSAPMPARVAHVDVAAGQHVDAGQTLLVLEAMKMELPLTAPHPGTVVAIRCEKGDLVSPGAPLVELRPDDADPAGGR